MTGQTFATWTATLEHLTPTVRRNRMRVARNLCLYRQRSEPACFIPDPADFPKPHQARRPYIFAARQIVRLLEVADQLQPTSNSPLHGPGLRLAIVLLYTSGLRRGELLRLTLADYDLADRTLHIRDTKFHKSRLVPLSSHGAREMKRYLKARRGFPNAANAPLLCSNSRGGLRHYTGTGLADGLRRLFALADVRTAAGRLPRIHDLRHTAVNRVMPS